MKSPEYFFFITFSNVILRNLYNINALDKIWLLKIQNLIYNL